MVSCACLISFHRTLYKGARAPLFAAVVSIQSGKCYCSPEGALAAPVIAASNGRHPPVLCSWLLLASARTALCWRRDERSPGSAQSRESLTQDSRSAVKARLFDPLRESFGEGRCTPCRADVSGLERGRHVGLRPSSREGTPLKAAPIVVCARTSLAVTLVDDAQTSAMRARYSLTPRRVASSRLTAHERREGLAQHAPHGGGDLRV